MRLLRAFTLCAAVSIFTRPQTASCAEPSKAAQEFDAGVRFFDAAEYPAAARAFLRADRLAPNSEAVANAITSALKTTDYLLVVEAARRGVERADDDAALAAKARQALAKARVHLAELELSCAPEPCTLELDGVEVEPGSHFVLPGTHSVRAHGAHHEEAADSTQSFEVGTRYRIELRVDEPAKTAQTARAAAPEPAEQSQAEPPEPTPPRDAPPDEPSDGVEPAWFYVGAGVTTVLLGLVVWSGLDTLSARSDAGDEAPPGEVDAIRAKRLRTDLLLAGTAVSAGVTAYVGLELVDWSGDSTSATSRTPQGAMLRWRGRF